VTEGVVIGGGVAPGYDGVREAFASNFTVRGEVGAAFAAYVDGEPVVNLWGGVADPERGRPWGPETLQLIFSGTKGLVAAVILVLLDRGGLGLDEPVSRYWPEFGASGKSHVTIGDALSHQAGVPGITGVVQAEELLDGAAMAERLARQAPLWSDKASFSYHALTYGWIAGELVRRITGVSIGTFFAREIAAPLDLEAWIGLPPSLERRVSTISVHESFRSVWQEAMALDGLAQIYENPPLFREPLIWNRPEFHSHEIPGANGIATARAMAALYGCLACGGSANGISLVTQPSIAASIRERSRGIDALSREWMAFGAGFFLQTPDVWFGPTAKAFGHTGAGGSVHGAWPTHRTGFSYTMNEMRDEIDDDRSRVLLASLYASVANSRASKRQRA